MKAERWRVEGNWTEPTNIKEKNNKKRQQKYFARKEKA